MRHLPNPLGFLLTLALLASGMRLASAQPPAGQPPLGQPHIEQPPIGQPGRMNRTEFESQLRLAQIYEETRDAQNALRVYEMLYAQDSLSSPVVDGLLRVMSGLKKFAEVERIARAQLVRRPANADMWLVLARAQALGNRRAEARESFAEAERRIADGRELTDECLVKLPIVMALTDVGMNEEAFSLMMRLRSGSDKNSTCSNQYATIYLRLGKYREAAEEYLAILAESDTYLPLIQQRIAQFTADSASRTQMIEAMERSVEDGKDKTSALQLMAWLYGEEKDYRKALKVVTAIDDQNAAVHGSGGYELMSFADRVRAEGALDVAVDAYELAIGRLRKGGGKQNDYFVSQAELGALMTKEQYLSQQSPRDMAKLAALVGQYESYAASQAHPDLAAGALLRGAQLAYNTLRDNARAKTLFQKVVTVSRGYNERSREATFGLVDIAAGQGEFAEASKLLNDLDGILSKRRPGQEEEVKRRSLYVRAEMDYFQGSFDSALARLADIVANPASDYANDAIALAGRINESNKGMDREALKMFAKAELAEQGRRYEEALGQYRSLIDGFPASKLIDDAVLRVATIEVELKRPAEALKMLELLPAKAPTSLRLDEAAFMAAEITEHELRDKTAAQRMYEELLEQFPKSTYQQEARERARRLRGDVF